MFFSFRRRSKENSSKKLSDVCAFRARFDNEIFYTSSEEFDYTNNDIIYLYKSYRSCVNTDGMFNNVFEIYEGFEDNIVHKNPSSSSRI